MDLEGLGPLHLQLQHHRRHLGLAGRRQRHRQGRRRQQHRQRGRRSAAPTTTRARSTRTATVTVRQGINYAQETYGIVPCVGLDNKIDLGRAGCALPKP